MTELSYTIHGDYAIPNLKSSNPADQPIGKYGRMRKRYLQEYRPVLYAFYTVHLGLNNISDYVQWNYTTQDGYSALLALNDTTGLIFVENEGRFISIIIEEVPDSNMVFTGLPNDKQFLEKVCDCFAFSEFSNE